MSDFPKRLIEVDLPIKRISAHARREKSIRHGHISTLHIWWARRPLAACRAVICAALWPDPADPHCPQTFRDRALQIISEFAAEVVRNNELGKSCAPETFAKWVSLAKTESRLDPTNRSHLNLLRFGLLDFIADFANWDNSTVPAYLEASRALTQAAHEALGGEAGSRPLVLDPFAGGGSIPLEALRIGADAFASDLNAIPVLLNKVALEDVPRFGQRLADEVRKWGTWLKAEAGNELSSFYPNDDDSATPIAYLWARTIISEAPANGNVPVEVPLLRSMWLSKRKDNLRALRWVRNSSSEIVTEIVTALVHGEFQQVQRPILEIFEPKSEREVPPGTAKGGSATCPVSGYTTPANRVKAQLTLQHGGASQARMFAVYVDRTSGRQFRIATPRDIDIYQKAAERARKYSESAPTAFPNEPINPIRPYKNTRGLSAVTRIGCTSFRDLYNPRQAFSISWFYDILRRFGCTDVGLEPNLKAAVHAALAFAVDRAVSQNTSMSRWDASRLTIKGAFSKQALAVVWDFAEANPFSGGSADWDGAVEWVAKFIEANHVIITPGTAVRATATAIPLPADSVAALITDPPYFAAIPYGDLSDFFFVWMRRGLEDAFPDLFSGELTDKSEELIVTNANTGKMGERKDDSYFRKGMTKALNSARECVQHSGIGVVVYAEGTTAGWEAILQAIIDSHWTVTSSWPIDTEMQNRTRAQRAASLQSSIHIVVRPRLSRNESKDKHEVGDWRDVLAALPRRIHEWMPRLANEGVVGADAIFACLGPALEVFSRYDRVEKASGEIVTLKEYLEHVWAAVSKEALTMVFAGADASGFEEDARLTAMWLWTLSATGNEKAESDEGEEDGEEEDDEEIPDEDEPKESDKKLKGYLLEFDAARKIAQGLGVQHWESLSSLVEIKGKKARLLPVAERTRKLFGKDEAESPSASRRKKSPQLKLGFVAELEEAEEAGSWGTKSTPTLGETVLDRVHQSMILFAAGRGEALRRFLVDEAVGRDERFWRLAQVLYYLYPSASDEKRWVDGVLARKKGLGFG